MTIISVKENLRKEMLLKRSQIPLLNKRRSDDLICQALWKKIIENNVQVLHTYLPMKSEVNILPVIKLALKNEITVITTKTLKKRQLENLVLTDLKNLEKGVFGTYHPKDSKIYNGDYDLIIVAGLAFSKDLFRVGYGGGYYDTFLADKQDSFKVGVGYSFQMVESVPTEAHDVQLDDIIIA